MKIEDLRLHQYLVTTRTEPGTWGVYCDACSNAVGDYVHPCRAMDSRGAPPRVLVDVTERNQVRRLVTALENELIEMGGDMGITAAMAIQRAYLGSLTISWL